MARSREITRQWQILRALAASRRGLTAQQLAGDQHVSTRTVRRDLAALERAGFPLVQHDGDPPVRWSVDPAVLQRAGRGWTLLELCALHFGGAALGSLAGSPFHEEVSEVFARLEEDLTAGMRRLVDRLPAAVDAKPAPGGKRRLRECHERVRQLLEASVRRRTVQMRYHSHTSRRVKDYIVEPHRVVHADGGLYLIGYVAAYGETRTFAIERIERLALRDQCFTAPEPSLPAFADSLGVHSGPPERIALEFEPPFAAWVAEREWHSSQTCRWLPDGRLRMELRVSVDAALLRWILGFGSQARVVAPAALAGRIFDELEAARDRYDDRCGVLAEWDVVSQRPLPFVELQQLVLQGESRA